MGVFPGVRARDGASLQRPLRELTNTMPTMGRKSLTPGRGRLCALTLGLWTGCASPPNLSALTTPPLPAGESLATLSLFEGWRDGPRVSFERDLAQWNQALEPHHLAPEDSRALADALEGLDEPAIRAALLLGHSRDPNAAELLLARLEDRVEGLERNSDGADVVAAATLATWPSDARFGERLVGLSTGDQPHPDLEVRVECASAALTRGHTAVVPFLLRVLRVGTPAQHSDPPDWAPKPTMAWSKSRAATALSRHLEIRVTFRPDSSYDDQLAEIARLVSLLGADASR